MSGRGAKSFCTPRKVVSTTSRGGEEFRTLGPAHMHVVCFRAVCATFCVMDALVVCL